MKASLSVVTLMDLAKTRGIVLGTRALDIGCGKGRNALFLARHGFAVSAFDAVETAIHIARERAAEASVAMELHVGFLDERWPYPDEAFDVVLDDTASMSIGYEAGMQVCRAEIARVLKPGGYAVVDALALDDPFLRCFPAGEEPNTVILPDGKVERLTTQEELRACYAQFHLIHQEACSKSGPTGRKRRAIWALFQKPF